LETASHSGLAVAEPSVPTARGFDQSQLAQESKWFRWRKRCASIIEYLLDAMAISVFHSREMVSVVNKIVEQFLPTTAVQATKAGNEDFLAYWLRTVAAMSAGHGVQAMSVVMILISCTGIFL